MDVEDLKAANPIEEIVGRYVALKRRGRDLWGCCPFHSERTPSFHMTPKKGTFHCFGCGAGGDVIAFVMVMEKLDFKAAVAFLSDGKVVIGEGSTVSRRNRRRKARELAAAMRRLHNLGERFIRARENMTDTDEAWDALKSSHDTFETEWRNLSWIASSSSDRWTASNEADSFMAILREGRHGFARWLDYQHAIAHGKADRSVVVENEIEYTSADGIPTKVKVQMQVGFRRSRGLEAWRRSDSRVHRALLSVLGSYRVIELQNSAREASEELYHSLVPLARECGVRLPLFPFVAGVDIALDDEKYSSLK